ncbi:MAG: NAD(P)-dependent oxidoreductase, partial [Bacteroidales bacterium]
MKILLTGGTGFIGSYILKSLLDRSYNVTVLARNANKVPIYHTISNLQVIEASMTDFEKIRKIVSGHDACIHVALNYNDSSAYSMLMDDTAPSIFLADECAKAGVKHFIYTSSTAANDNIYANPNPQITGAEGSHVTVTSKHDPHTYYGATKAATENFLMGIEGITGMRVNIVRPGYTFGNPVFPGAFTQPDRRFHSIVSRALKGEPIEIIKNDGTQFLWAGDLAKIYMSVLDANFS